MNDRRGRWSDRAYAGPEGVEMFRSVVTFTGGMGAQILSMALYDYLTLSEGSCLAEVSYFDRPPRIAQPGGGISIFPWELGTFGIPIARLNRVRGRLAPELRLLADENPDKGRLAWGALQVSEVRALFPIEDNIRSRVLELAGEDRYACLHVRQGDYLNVASYLVPLQANLDAIRIAGNLFGRLVVLSDSILPDAIVQSLERSPAACTIIEGSPPPLSHAIMRLSSLLFCANSQFSLTAALLSTPEAMRLAPKYYGRICGLDSSASPAESLLYDNSYWQMLDIRDEPFSRVNPSVG